MLSEIIPKIAGMEQKEYAYRHRCSSATYGERCLRQSVYHALDIPSQPFPDRMAVTLDDSSWHEELTLDWIRKSAYKVHSQQLKVEVVFHQGITIQGAIDGIITDLEGKDFLLEHKAINHFTFTRYEEGKAFPVDYICQTVCYIVGLKKIVDSYLPAILLIKNKNTSKYLEYHIKYDEQADTAHVRLFVMSYENERGALVEKSENFVGEIIEKVGARFSEIDKCVSLKELPKRAYAIDDWHCEYCRWARLCWKDFVAEQDTRKTGVDMSSFLDTFEKYLKAKEQRLLSEKIEEEEKGKMCTYMRAESLKTGIIGENILTLTIASKSSIDKSLISADVLAQATKTTPYEKFSITRIKKEKEPKIKKEVKPCTMQSLEQ